MGASSLGDMANSFSIQVHREDDRATTVGVQEYAIMVAVRGNTPKPRHSVDVHLGVADPFGFACCQMQAFIDVPNRRQIQVRPRHTFCDRCEKLCHLFVLCAYHFPVAFVVRSSVSSVNWERQCLYLVLVQYDRCGTLPDDNTWCHRVTGCYTWHNRSIGDAKVIETVDLQVAINYGHRVTPHSGGRGL